MFGMTRPVATMAPEEYEDEKKRLAVYVAEDGVPTIDAWRALEDEIPVAAPESSVRKVTLPKADAPLSPSVMPSKLGMTPATSRKPLPQAMADAELAQAKDADATARSRRAMELAARQMVSGLAGRPSYNGPLLESGEGGAEARLLSQRERMRAEALRQLEADKDNARADAALGLQRESAEAARKRQEDEDAWRKSEKDQDQEQRKLDAEARKATAEAFLRMNQGRYGLAVKADKRAEEEAARKAAKADEPTVSERRQQQRDDALAPRPGWEKIDDKAAAFRTPAQAEKFDAAEAAFGALQNHRKHAGDAIAKYRAALKAGDVNESRKWLGVANQQMGNLASKLRSAEGLNNSDAANEAVDTMLSLHKGSIETLGNLINEGKLDAILDSAIESSGVNLDTMAKSANLRRAAPKSADAVKVRRKSDGVVKVLTAAQAAEVLKKDGYERVE